MPNPQTPLPTWLRSQAVRRADIGPTETEWCERMKEAARVVEQLDAVVAYLELGRGEWTAELMEARDAAVARYREMNRCR